jgi:hypothetical protein
MSKYDQNDAVKGNQMKSAAGLLCAVYLLFMPLLTSYLSVTYTK